MNVAVYMRFGNKEQPDPETDMKKREQEFENFFEKKKHQTVGEYVTQKDREEFNDIVEMLKENGTSAVSRKPTENMAPDADNPLYKPDGLATRGKGNPRAR